MSELAATRTLPPPSMKDVIVSTFIFPPKSENNPKWYHRLLVQGGKYFILIYNTKINLPSTDGEKMIKWSYRNCPYLIKDRDGSSAVLNVRSKPRSETVTTELKQTLYSCFFYIPVYTLAIKKWQKIKTQSNIFLMLEKKKKWSSKTFIKSLWIDRRII